MCGWCDLCWGVGVVVVVVGIGMGCRLDVYVLAFCVSSVFCNIFSQWDVKT